MPSEKKDIHCKRSTQEMVQAARIYFEESLTQPAVPALAEREWRDRVGFPFGMDEDGELFFDPEAPR